MLLNVWTKNEVCRFKFTVKFEIWTIVWKKLKWRHYDVIPQMTFLKFLQKTAKVISKWHTKFQIDKTVGKLTENYEGKMNLCRCDLDLWPKVTNFNRVRASVLSNRLAKISASVWLEFCSQAESDTQTKCSENITPPRFRGGVTNGDIS